MGLVSFRVAQRDSISLSEASAQKYVQKKFFQTFPMHIWHKTKWNSLQIRKIQKSFQETQVFPKNIEYWLFLDLQTKHEPSTYYLLENGIPK